MAKHACLLSRVPMLLFAALVLASCETGPKGPTVHAGAPVSDTTSTTDFGTPNEQGVIGTLHTPLGSRGTELSAGQTSTVPFKTLGLKGYVPTATWQIDDSAVSFVFDDPTLGHFAVDESPSQNVTDWPPSDLPSVDTLEVRGHLVTNASGQSAVLYVRGNFISVDWVHDGLSIHILGNTDNFTDAQAEMVAKLLS